MIKKITILLFVGLLCSISYNSISNSSGPPLQNTGAPGEGNCTGCHSGSLITSGSNWNNISLTGNFSGNGYLPDSTYTLKISYSQSGISKWGFEATILDAGNSKAGTLSASGRVQKSSTSAREYVLQTSSGNSSTSTNATEWSFTWKAPAKNVGPLKLYLNLNAADGSSGTGGDQIYAKSFTINPSSLIPVANATCVDSVTCAENTITLNGTSTQNPTAWSWVLTGATPNVSTAQNPSVKYNTAGTYWAILTSKNAKAFSKADSLKIIVRAKPVVSISGPTSYTLCKGDSVKLTATFNANYKYTWAPGGSVTQSIWAKDTGRYTVTVTDNNKCSRTSSIVKIAHNPYYTLNISRDVSSDTVCFERPIRVTANSSATFDSIFYYSSFGALQRTVKNPETFLLSSSTDLFARGKDSKGCLTPKSNALNFVVKTGVSAPTASCTNKTTASFEISWGSVTNALGYKVSIDSGKTWQDPSTGATGLSHKVLGFPPNTDVEIWLKALDVFPCYESTITKVVCGSIPCSPITYDLVWDKEACKGKDINFKIRNLNTNYFALKIDNGNTFKDTSFVITADFSRTYKFELTDSSNLSCPSIKRDAAVKVWEIPSIVLSSNNAQNIFCEGNQANFEVVSKGMQEYNFFLNNVSKQKSASSSWNLANPKNLDSVWVAVTNGACKESSDRIKLGVKPLPTANFTYSFNGRTATFNANETGNVIYKWYFGDGNKDTTTKNPTHKYAGSGTSNVWAKLTVIDEFGCTSTDSVKLEIPASVTNTFQDYGINVYPQPAKNSFTIEIPSDLINAEIGMMDATGRMVIKTIADKKVTEIITTDLPSGVYMLMVTKGTSRFNGKVIISR
jgi:PKD repeat protein